MSMNKNEISFKNITIDIPRIDSFQNTLLKGVKNSIKKSIKRDNSYYITLNTFVDVPYSELKKILKMNFKVSIFKKNIDEWYTCDLLTEIKIKNEKIFFRPSNILLEIIENKKQTKEHFFLKYILFNGIRYKQTLLFLEYMIKQKNVFIVELDDLREILEHTENYKHFSSFKSTVIQRIIADIVTKTKYYVSVTHTKNNDKTFSFEFTYYDSTPSKAKNV